MDYEHIKEIAMRAAREAGTLARASSGNPGYQQWKGARDLVVGSVFPVQERIIEIIRSEFPDHAILAEENEEQPSADADPLWIVDPIDGTQNFSQGIPHYAISIAYREEGIYRVGVVYDPNTDEMFHAIQGRYARLNNTPITVRQVAEGEDAYNQAVIATDLPGGVDARLHNLRIASILADQCISLNVIGSPALALCYLAAGRLHGYFSLAPQLWDVAAASVILDESGGVLSDIRGGSWLHRTAGYIASNRVIHGWILRACIGVMDPHRVG